MLEHIRQADWPADLLALTGDLIQDDSRAAYQRVRDMLEPLGLPVLCVPGNHDVRELMRDTLRAPGFLYCDSIELRNWLIVGIDSCLEGTAGGRVGDEEMARLEQLLAETSADHALVCLHHPPLPVGSHWLDQVGLHNGGQFLERVAGSGRVRATVFGHVHQDFDEQYRNVRILGTPSTCRQFKLHSAVFALDDRPPAYRRISLHAGGRLDEQLIWVD